MKKTPVKKAAIVAVPLPVKIEVVPPKRSHKSKFSQGRAFAKKYMQ